MKTSTNGSIISEIIQWTSKFKCFFMIPVITLIIRIIFTKIKLIHLYKNIFQESLFLLKQREIKNCQPYLYIFLAVIRRQNSCAKTLLTLCHRLIASHHSKLLLKLSCSNYITFSLRFNYCRG